MRKKILIEMIIIVLVLLIPCTNVYAYTQDELCAELIHRVIEDGENPLDSMTRPELATPEVIKIMLPLEIRYKLEEYENAYFTGAYVQPYSGPKYYVSGMYNHYQKTGMYVSGGTALNPIVVYEKPKHSHSYTEENIIEAKCEGAGSITYSCECGESYTESIDAIGHKYETEITKEAVCGVDGEKTFKCSLCGDTYVEAIKALEHEKGAWVITRDSTCIAEGEKINCCKKCSKVLETEIIPALGHTEGEWKIETEATMIHKGENIQRCVICDEILQIEELSIDIVSWYYVVGIGVVLILAVGGVVTIKNKKKN